MATKHKERRQLRAASFRESLLVDAVPVDRDVHREPWRHVHVHCSGAGPGEDPPVRAAALAREAPCGDALAQLMRRPRRPSSGDIAVGDGTIRVWGTPFEVNRLGSDRVILVGATFFAAIVHGEGDAP